VWLRARDKFKNNKKLYKTTNEIHDESQLVEGSPLTSLEQLASSSYNIIAKGSLEMSRFLI
jgi:hypothetical protein